MNKIAEIICSEDYTKRETEIHYIPEEYSEYINLARFMTGYNWEVGQVESKLEFIQSKNPKIKLNTLKDVKHVVLLSGGVDTLAGMSWLKNNSKLDNTLFVTFSTNTVELKAAYSTMEEISKISKNTHHIVYSKRWIKHNGKKSKEKNKKQRTRTLWFLSCAIDAMEKISGKPELYLFENGVVSLNPKVTIDRLLTRTTHPKTIEMIASKSNVKIETPFMYMTKAEILKQNNVPQFAALLKSRITCSKGRMFKYGDQSINNCGLCLGCMIRRIAEGENEDTSSNYRFLNVYDAVKSIKESTGDSKSSFIDDVWSMSHYFRKMKTLIDSGGIDFYIPRKKEYMDMMSRFGKELERNMEVWEWII